MAAAAVARRKGFEDETAAIQSQVARWGLPKSAAEFDKALAGVALPKPLVDAALLGYWPLDEGSGTTTADASGKLVGRINGAVWTTGKFGSALRFDGANAVLDLPNTPELDRLQRGDYTLAAWVKPEGRAVNPGDQYSIIVKAGYNMGLAFNHQSRFIIGQWLGEKDPRYLQADSGNAYDPGTVLSCRGHGRRERRHDAPLRQWHPRKRIPAGPRKLRPSTTGPLRGAWAAVSREGINTGQGPKRSLTRSGSTRGRSMPPRWKSCTARVPPCGSRKISSRNP